MHAQDEESRKITSCSGLSVMSWLNSWSGEDVTNAAAPDYEPQQLRLQIRQQCEATGRHVADNMQRCGDATSHVWWALLKVAAIAFAF